MSGQTIGYVRTSSFGQNSARQLDGLHLDRVFEDTCSGSSTNRPALKAMLEHVRVGDRLQVHSIDRLARNTSDLLALVKQLQEKGVEVQFMKEGLTFSGDKSNAMNQLLLTMLGAVASFELSMINERRAEGQQKAREAGKHMGRNPSLSAPAVEAIKQRAAQGESKVDLALEYGVSRATIYAAIKAAA